MLFFASFQHDFELLGLLAWVALVPWLFVALRADRTTAIVTSYGTTFLYHLLGLSWIGLVTGPGWIATTFLEGFYSVAIVLAVRWMRRITALPVSVLLPPLWVMGEHHRGAHLWFIKFPWLLIGQTQHARTNLIQICDLTSIYGLSFLVVLVNAFVIDVLLLLAERNAAEKDLDDKDKRYLLKLAIYPVALLLLANLYGLIRTGQVERATIEGPKLLAVQCDVPQELKEDLTRDPARELASQNFAVTEAALQAIKDDKERPDAILWSETVWMYPFNYEYPSWDLFRKAWIDRRQPGWGAWVVEMNQRLFGTATRHNTDLIFGAYDRGPMEDWLDDDDKKSHHLANRVWQIGPLPDPKTGKCVREHYDKINLVPASEGIPGKTGDWFHDFIKSFVPQGFQTLEPGDEPHVMTLGRPRPDGEHWKINCDICFEISFPELIREGTLKGADVHFCPSNDGWFHTSDDISSAEIPLALDHAVFRAIENRRGFVRIVNRGITCFIGPTGEVLQEVSGMRRTPAGPVPSKLYVTGSIMANVPTTHLTTVYVQIGDTFAWLCWVASIGLIALSFQRRRTAAPSPS
ncbi:MAG TPA: apolipoprotein N-acyltransferase [Planctomycetota bacterium]|nr:apolipoprotein N-acyltransferase [Planctomycetota bacterium]